MSSGLPTFGPKFGGPLEIIEYGVSGLLLNTSKPKFISDSLEAFHTTCSRDESYWDRLSKNGIKRVKESFTWNLYSQRLINLTKLYGFWRYSVSGKGKIKMDRYSDFLYYFLIRERARRRA
jgi:sucrose synthase